MSNEIVAVGIKEIPITDADKPVNVWIPKYFLESNKAGPGDKILVLRNAEKANELILRLEKSKESQSGET